MTSMSTLVAAAALLVGVPSFAQEATPAPEYDRFVSTLSRAEVAAAAQTAVRHDRILRSEADGAVYALGGDAASSLSRQQVLAEAVEAHRLGLVGHGEADLPTATSAQWEAVRRAGQRAVDATHVAQRH